MSNLVKIKRSAVAAKVPSTADLSSGELAINTHDGRLFLKKDDGTESIVDVGHPPTTLRTVTVTGSAVVTDAVVVIDASAGNVNFTLLSASLTGSRSIKIQRSRADPGTNTVTLLKSGGETIGGETSITLLPGEGYEFIPDGGTDHIQF